MTLYASVMAQTDHFTYPFVIENGGNVKMFKSLQVEAVFSAQFGLESVHIYKIL